MDIDDYQDEIIKFAEDVRNNTSSEYDFAYFRNKNIHSKLLSEIAYEYFTRLSFEQTVSISQSENYALRCYLHHIEPERMGVEELVSDISFIGERSKYAILYLYWSEQTPQSKLDLDIVSKLLVQNYSYVSKRHLAHILSNIPEIEGKSPYLYLSDAAISSLLDSDSAIKHIEPRLDINRLNSDQITKILSTNAKKLDDNTGYSPQFLQNCFCRYVDLTSDLFKVFCKLNRFMPLASLGRIVNTPLTDMILFVALLQVTNNPQSYETYINTYYEYNKGVEKYIPGIDTEKGRLQLKDTYFPSFDNIITLDSVCTTSDLVRMATNVNKVKDSIDILPEMVF